jgi:hypothetical protein
LDEPLPDRDESSAAVTSLAPVPTESSTCAHCGAALVADQRYCLSCGQPCTPVRLAFLDVLESERQPQLAAGPAGTMPVAYAGGYTEPTAGPPWLRRYAPLFGVAAVLLLAMIAGLLVGHWASQGKATASAPQVIKVEGLSSAPVTTTAGATPTPTSTGASTTTPATSGKSAASTKSEEEQEKAEAKAEEKAEEKAPAKAPPAKPLDSKSATKLEKSTGKQKEAELNKVTTAPIEVK